MRMQCDWDQKETGQAGCSFDDNSLGTWTGYDPLPIVQKGRWAERN